MSPARTVKYTPGIGVFAVFVFVLVAIPKANVQIGPAPLYLIDILVALATIYALKVPGYPRGTRPFGRIVLALSVFAVLGEIAGAVYIGAVFEPAYLIGRTALAFLVFFVTGQLVRTPKDLELVLKAAALGVVVTASLMILTSLPMTRAPVLDLMSNRFLDPMARRGTITLFRGETERGIRGQSWVGVSILGATFLNMAWPLAALLLRWPLRIGPWRVVATTACLLAPMGILASYSRGPILGAVLMILAVTVFGLRRLRRGILMPVLFTAVVILLVGIGSQIFFFERLTNRTTAMLDAPLDDAREAERALAYVEPFDHVIMHPLFLILGEGTSIRRSSEVLSEQTGQATHAVFGIAYYSRGMIAVFLYIILILGSLRFAMKQAFRNTEGLGAYYSQAVLLSVIAVVPWAAFAHSIVSEPRASMMFFFVLGMMTSLRHFSIGNTTATINEDRYLDRRAAAV